MGQPKFRGANLTPPPPPPVSLSKGLCASPDQCAAAPTHAPAIAEGNETLAGPLAKWEIYTWMRIFFENVRFFGPRPRLLVCIGCILMCVHCLMTDGAVKTFFYIFFKNK